MRTFFVLILSVLFVANSAAVVASSRAEAVFQEENPYLFNEYVYARDLLDSWRGERAVLLQMVAKLHRILDTDETFAPAQYLLGRYYIAQSSYGLDRFGNNPLHDAELILTHAARLAPDYPEVVVSLAHVYTRLGHLDQAEALLIKATEMDSRTRWLDVTWGHLFWARGKYTDAYAHFLNAVSAGGTYGRATYEAMRGAIDCEIQAGELVSAKNRLQLLVELNPDASEVQLKYAKFLLFQAGEFDAALATAEHAFEIADTVETRVVLAAAHYASWASLTARTGADARSAAARHFMDAAVYYPHVSDVIRVLSEFSTTRAIAQMLQQSIEKNIGADAGDPFNRLDSANRDTQFHRANQANQRE